MQKVYEGKWRTAEGVLTMVMQTVSQVTADSWTVTELGSRGAVELSIQQFWRDTSESPRELYAQRQTATIVHTEDPGPLDYFGDVYGFGDRG